jgi:hypothetical protein
MYFQPFKSVMRPGTLHMVISLEDSVSTGGMFYNPKCYDLTLDTIVQLHHDGMRLSNSNYPGSQLILFQLFAHYHSKLVNAGFYRMSSYDKTHLC